MRIFINKSIVHLSAFIVSVLLNSTPSFCQSQLSGWVMNAQNKQALSFVNIGIRGKNIGCISMENGRFDLPVPKEHLQDSLSFSHVGFKEQTFLIQDLLKTKENRVELLPISSYLPEVKVSAKDRWKTEKFGMARQFGAQVNFSISNNKHISISEIGQKLDLGSVPHKIQSFNIYLVDNLMDSATFRINFYTFNGSEPGGRAYNQEVLITRPLKKGWLKLDLEPFNIWLEGKVLASIEFLRTRPNARFLSPWIGGVAFSNKDLSYYRNTSMGSWEKQPEPLSIFVEAKQRIRKE